MSTPVWIQAASTILGAGGAGWFGAWLKHRRLKSAPIREEKKLEKKLEAVDKRLAEHIEALSLHIDQYKANNAGWLLELTQLKNELEEDRKVREAIEEERSSRPDPFEDIKHEINEIRRGLDRLKERSGRYVKNEAFEAFMKLQEEQWREMNRHLGRLEGALK